MTQVRFKPAISLDDYVGLVKQSKRPTRESRDLPRKLKPRLVSLHYLLTHLDPDMAYSEEHINLLIQYRNPFGIDHVQLRRLLVDYSMLERTPDGGEYRASDGYLAEAEWDPQIVGPAPRAEG
jgi:hypothetical protein